MADLIDRAVELARRLQARAIELQTPHERHQQAELDRMLQHPADKVTLLQMTDQAFRSSTPARAVEQLTHILDVQGIPRFFSPVDRALLHGLRSLGGYLPGVTAPLVQERLQHETASVVVPAEPEELRAHLRARRAEGVRVNLNFLGEAVLGEHEAERRLQEYLAALQDPDVEVVSVKISTLYSQVSPIAREHTLGVLSDRIELLVRAAAREHVRRADGRTGAKLVYLDMEEYRDMLLTAEAFMRALDRVPAAPGGLALQAYIPDSFAMQRRVTGWAMRRVAAGGSPITIRIVKGANLEMERVEASIAGWPQAPFETKRETDANYKRMLGWAFEPDHARAVRVGIASHNLFELAYGLVLAESRGVPDRVQIEMLEGMATHQRRALSEHARDVLLYAPACRRERFVNAIGYLVRRLDENTGADNFLRHAFRLAVDSDEWRALEAGFRASFPAIDELPDGPRRTQDRRRPPVPAMPAHAPLTRFVNEPGTDWSLPHHAAWARSIVEEWQRAEALEAPLVVAGRALWDRRVGESTDPSRPGLVVGRFRVAEPADVDEAVACARDDPDGWRALRAAERGAILRRVAQRIRERRGTLMGIALAEGGKVLGESDPEVSEAVDFCELYARAAEWFAALDGIATGGLGVVAVVPPWNFPIAIPCGGVAAALAAGNTVILKPAPATVLTGYVLCECFWEAGVSQRTLQFVYGDDDHAATALVTHDGVDAVVFTGGTATAHHLLSLKPALRLLAETGGKNATIVTAMSDRELAIKHVVHSAFGHAGQKCSATSLLILEDEVYRDDGFKRMLCDAVESLRVGPAWHPATTVGPLIRQPTGKLERGLKELEPGESWGVRPRRVSDNPNLWSPGVKWGVRPGSFTHMTELFGPVLGVMRAANLEEAIALVNATGYGLTSGLESLDERERDVWAASVRAGNLYANRGTTGAVVLRQPFGGMGKSAIGPGVKAGGINYLVPLMRVLDTEAPLRGPAGAEIEAWLASMDERAILDRETLVRLTKAVRSYAWGMREEFLVEHDHFRLVGQDNIRRYRAVERMCVRVARADSAFEVLARVCAAKIAGAGVHVSCAPARSTAIAEWLDEPAHVWPGGVEVTEEDDETFAGRMGTIERVRYAGDDRVPSVVRRAAGEAGSYVAAAPVLIEGRVELLWYLREQSVCIDYHRYGNLGARGASRARE
jgi:RHH-type proline utilization regulon transcriptional repressor/proline dehydrogenase/delta 1-pyrroline-5-carboxylate dehydrogenase